MQVGVDVTTELITSTSVTEGRVARQTLKEDQVARLAGRMSSLKDSGLRFAITGSPRSQS